MATQFAQYSATLEDDKGERTSVAAYLQYDDATATLSSLMSALAGITTNLDAITDAKVIKHSLALTSALPGGVKASAVADCDNEETGLFSFVSDSPNSAAYAVDVPAIKSTLLDGKNIIVSSGAGQTFVNMITSPSGTLVWTDNTFSNLLPTLRTAQKTFRKHRRAAKRV